jgi:AcrR family transcriptional regulator
MTTQRATVDHTRQRIVLAASELFYRQGIAATGVDAVVAHAGLSKPTLYRYFPSKDHLVEAYLVHRDQENRAALESVLSRHPDGSIERLLAVFDWLHEWHNSSTFRGCAFVRAASEIDRLDHPATEIIRSRKTWLRSRLRALAREAGIAVPVQFGDALMLLVEGATTTAFVEGDLRAARKAQRVAQALITLFPAAK